MSRVARKTAVPLSDLIREYIQASKLTAGLNTQRIFAAWDACSGAGPFTLRRYFRGGTLYITLNSSVIRNQLYFQRDVLVEKINARLAEDELFTKDNRLVGTVRQIILK